MNASELQISLLDGLSLLFTTLPAGVTMKIQKQLLQMMKIHGFWWPPHPDLPCDGEQQCGGLEQAGQVDLRLLSWELEEWILQNIVQVEKPHVERPLEIVI